VVAFPDTLKTEFLFDADIGLEAPQQIGATPFGARSVHLVTGGTFEGPRMRGMYLPGGGDWLLTLPNGAGELDVRATLQTDDGALIHMLYHGVLDASAEVIRRVFGGEDVDPAEYYFRTAPRFETGAGKYAWLNKLVCIGVGAFGIQKVAYRVFAVE
jgi:uncharacterized protein DUF3237